MRPILGISMLCLALLAVPAAAQTNTAIAAGQHIGGIRIGSNVNDAVATLGNLFERSDTRSGKFTAYAWPLRPIFLFAEKETGRIVLLVVSLSDVYRTERGITSGTERAAVETAHGKEYTTDEDQTSITLIYDALGIAFDIGKVGVMSGRVVQIVVFPAGQWKQITEGL